MLDMCVNSGITLEYIKNRKFLSATSLNSSEVTKSMCGMNDGIEPVFS